MSNLTERLLVLRDELDLDELSGANTLTEAANRIEELEAAASSRHDPELPRSMAKGEDR